MHHLPRVRTRPTPLQLSTLQYQWSLAFNLPPNLPGILLREPAMDNWLRCAARFSLRPGGSGSGSLCGRSLRDLPF